MVTSNTFILNNYKWNPSGARALHGQPPVNSPYLCLRMKFGPRQHGKDWTKTRHRNHWCCRNDRKYTNAQINTDKKALAEVAW